MKEDGSSKNESAEMVKLRAEMAALRELVKAQSGGVETAAIIPLSEDIENAKVDMNLKIPSIELFDGTTDPLDFLNMFDGRMSFFRHEEIARCRFFCTCLKGTALEWFNNLPPRSIDSWQALKTKFRTRFSSNRRGGKITASLMTIRQ